MSLDFLRDAVDAFFASPASGSHILDLVSAMAEIPTFLSQSHDDFLTKLQRIGDAGFFRAILRMLREMIDPTVQLKILRFWDLLVSTSSSRDEFNLLFRDGITNSVIVFPWATSLDVLQAYMSVLKGIAMKLDFLSLDDLISEDSNTCPLYLNVIQLIAFPDSVTISASRFVVLKLCSSGKPELMRYIAENTPRGPFEKLIASSDRDRFAFLSDLFEIAPSGLTRQLLQILRQYMDSHRSDVLFASQAAQFLGTGPARDILADHLSQNLPLFELKQPLALGVLLFALTHRLIYLDAAIRSGLIPKEQEPKIQRFSDRVPQNKAGNFLEELANLFEFSIDIVQTSLLLRIFEVLCKEPPECIIVARGKVIDAILRERSASLMQFLIQEHRAQRCDLDFLETCECAGSNPSDVSRQVTRLREIQASIGRWRRRPPVWLTFEGCQNEEESFVTADQRAVSVSGSKVALPDGRREKLWDLFINDTAKKKAGKIVSITIIRPATTTLRRSLSVGAPIGEQLKLTFSHTHIASAFEAKVIARQYEIIERAFLQLRDECPFR
jgi:hypothetical protein